MKPAHAPTRIPVPLWTLLAIYCVASLIHFVHNAEFLAAYPNLPATLTRSTVYVAWLAIAAVGAAGILAIKLRRRVIGLVLLAVYAALGFAGLDHYWVAPLSAHTLAMNATIAFEVAAAASLLELVAYLLVRTRRTAIAERDASSMCERDPR